MLSITQINNLRDAAKHAHHCELIAKIPCELTLAQWALESGWGAHSPGNNCFGIKEYPNCYGRQLLRTYEYFTKEERYDWLAAKPGRIANLVDATYNSKSQQRFNCDDWFATFQDLTACFMKRAQLLHSAPYITFITRYTQDGNLTNLINDLSKVYATDPDYNDKLFAIASIKEVEAAIAEVRQARG